MHSNSKYQEYLIDNGIVLQEGDYKDYLLSVKNALTAIEILKNNNTIIIGGNIYTFEDKEPFQAYQRWGSQYAYLNWSTDPIKGEKNEDYILRTYQNAIININKANDVANKLGMDCFIQFVISNISI